jgi:myo-inositol-1(or 4)-monophosphatase
MKNGVLRASLARAGLTDAVIGGGIFNADSGGWFPGRYRLGVLEELSRGCRRGCGCMVLPGSTWSMLPADAIVGGAGDYVWDHAAGCGVGARDGGVVTNLAGEAWTPRFAVGVGRRPPGVYERVLGILRGVGRPDEF